MASVAARHISKSFGATAVLRDIELDIRDGEFLTLLGPSGCGKSTLLRIMAGLELQDEGNIAIGGQAVDHCAPKQRDVAMVFQSYALYPYMTVAQNMALPLVMRQMTAAQRLPLVGRFMAGARAARAHIDARVRKVADQLAIGALLDRKPAQLSGGQRQRVALGRAMVRDPKVFLMDEPLSNLDAKLRTHMRSELAALHRRLGTTFIYVTHDQSEAMTMSDRVALMWEGRIVQVAQPATLYNDPQTIEVAEFVGSPKINILPAQQLAGGTLAVCGVTLPLRLSSIAGSGARVGIRCENLGVAHQPSPGSIAGTIIYLENTGADCFLHVAVEKSASLIARVGSDRLHEFRIGAPVHLAPAAAGILAFDAAGNRLPASAESVRGRRHG